MKSKKKILQELNLQVMQIIWDKDKATVHDIRDELARHRKISYSTVATVVGRLEKQGYLTHEKMEHMHLYIPFVSKEEVTQNMVGDMVDRLFDGSAVGLFNALLGGKMVSQQELMEIKEHINRYESERNGTDLDKY
jgi:predicted transcriptional regulator